MSTTNPNPTPPDASNLNLIRFPHDHMSFTSAKLRGEIAPFDFSLPITTSLPSPSSDILFTNLAPIKSTQSSCLICKQHLIQHLHSDPASKQLVPTQWKPAFKLLGDGTVVHEACSYAFSTEIHHPPVVKDVHLWTMRGALVKGRWTATMVWESVDRVMLKEFWDVEEIDGLYGVEKVAEKGEEKVVKEEEVVVEKEEEAAKPKVQMRIPGAWPVEAYPVDKWFVHGPNSV